MTDRFLRACRREPVDRTPLWIMRQAGRYLPEYRELRSRVSFLELCRTPELAAEATLQPLRRFAFDAAIMFSDIMIPLDAFGIPMTFEPGPKIAEPIRSRAQVDRLSARPAAEAVPFVADTIRLLRRELDGRTPLIGFCGAPFTIAAYLVQGEGKEGFAAIKRLMYREPATLEALIEKLSVSMADYLRLQIDAGAQAVQIFDSWCGILDEADYRRFALPGVSHLLQTARAAGVPAISRSPSLTPRRKSSPRRVPPAGLADCEGRGRGAVVWRGEGEGFGRSIVRSTGRRTGCAVGSGTGCASDERIGATAA